MRAPRGIDASADVPLEVAYRDDELLVVIKPAGLPTTSPDGRGCLTERVHALDPRAPRLHASSRLDAEVTGLVTFARTTRAIEALLAARRAGTYGRCYVALTARAPTPPAGEWRRAIALDGRDKRLRAWDGSPRAAAGERRDAHSTYATAAERPLAVALHLRPHTGRTHQLRVHCAAAGLPILGDVAYGGAARITALDGRVIAARRVLLHCALLELPRIGDVSGARLAVRAPLPADLLGVWTSLGGEAASLVPAVESPAPG